VAFGRIIAVALAVVALGLSGCGRYGPLQPPPPEPGEAPPETAQQDPKPEERKSFLLDFLIQ
jgi:predicted small lipoprotein YifL